MKGGRHTLIRHVRKGGDIFGGGGTIALEAGRLGCETFTLDINPLAYFIQKFILEYSQERQDLPELVKNMERAC
jgi:putative DNA methylase